MAQGEAAEACLLALQAWLLALATTVLAFGTLASVAYRSLLGLPGVQLTFRLAQRVAPAWALGSAARPRAALSGTAAASHDVTFPNAEPPAAPEQPESSELAGGSPPQPRRRSIAALRASSSELEPIAENVVEEAGWGGADWWKPGAEGGEQAAVEAPYTRLASLSLPASAELPGAVEAGTPLPVHYLTQAAQSLEEEPLLQKAPTSSSPVTAAEEGGTSPAAQQAQQAAEAAAAAFAIEAAAAAGAPAASGEDQPVPRPASVENAEAADVLLGGSGSPTAPAPAEGTAVSAGGSNQGSLAAVAGDTSLPFEAVSEEALLPAEIQPSLLPAELPPALPPAEIEPALLPAELPPAGLPAELPPALLPIPAEAAMELPVAQLAEAQAAPGTTSDSRGGGAGAALLSGAMLRSPPRGLEEEEEEEPFMAAGGSGSPLSAPTAGATPAGRVLQMGLAAAGEAIPPSAVPTMPPAMPESLFEGPLSAVPPPKPLPLRPPSPTATASFEAAAAALGSGGPTFAAAGGKLGAPFQLRGDGSNEVCGNPFCPATPSIDHVAPAPAVPAEPADEPSPPALPPPPPASRAGTAFTRELAAAAADLVDGTAPG